jgi:hypothetical protein
MTSDKLERACIEFEDEHGIDAFLEAMAEIMQRRLLRHGLEIQLDGRDEVAAYGALLPPANG